MNWLKATTIFAAAFCVALSSYAQTPVDTIQTWTNPDTAGWTNDISQTTLSNPGGYLNMQFPQQSSPNNQSDIMRLDLASGTLFTNISFAFFAADVCPSAVRLCMHSAASDNLWYVNLPNPPQGQWTTYNVPVDFSMASWIIGPDNSEEQFQRDMLSVDWVGVYVRRHSDVGVQNYGIDDFEMMGVTLPDSISISGTVQYSGEQSGPIFVCVAGGPTGTVTTVLAAPGSYQFTGLPLGNDYTISAFLDSNNNSTQEYWEASGSWIGNPARVCISSLTGVDITMLDPMRLDGLPYWWVHQYFGDSEPTGQGGNGQSLAETDSDSDGMSNYAEYIAGTDPTDFLSVFSVNISPIDLGNGTTGVMVGWNSVRNRTYTVWRTADLTKGFTKIVSGLVATPPWNEYEDPDAGNGSNYFYRIQVQLE